MIWLEILINWSVVVTGLGTTLAGVAIIAGLKWLQDRGPSARSNELLRSLIADSDKKIEDLTSKQADLTTEIARVTGDNVLLTRAMAVVGVRNALLATRMTQIEDLYVKETGKSLPVMPTLPPIPPVPTTVYQSTF